MSKPQAVANLRTIYAAMNGGKEGGSDESLRRQWKEWEAGRVRPQHWARYLAAAFGTVKDDLFPPDRAEVHLIDAAGMDTAELMARLRQSAIDDATLTRSTHHGQTVHRVPIPIAVGAAE